jgi:glucosamine--fructose-6-phosphate aminotransferase (isomerizing)
LNEAHPAVAAYLVNWKDYVRSLAQVLKDTRYLYLVGRGASLASAATGALIVKESAHFPAEGMSSAAFRHGPFEMLGNQTFVLVFAGDARTRKLNERLRDDIQEQKGRAELVEKDASLPCCCIPEHGSSIQQILEILPAQMMTLALAARAGREAGRFEFVTKVTTIE